MRHPATHLLGPKAWPPTFALTVVGRGSRAQEIRYSVFFVASVSGPIMMTRDPEEQAAGGWFRCF